MHADIIHTLTILGDALRNYRVLARHPLGVGSVRISTYFLFHNLFFSFSYAHLCLHSNDAQISPSCFQIRRPVQLLFRLTDLVK